MDKFGMRDDAMLYTGMTSASFARQKVATEKRKEEKTEKLQQLLPAADVVFAEIKKEKALIAQNVLKCVAMDTPEENIKSLLLSYRMYDVYLSKFQGSLATILRLSKKEQEDDL